MPRREIFELVETGFRVAGGLKSLVSGATIDRAGRIITRGGIVAFPTETSYGLAVNPASADALRRLRELKRRAAAKPFLLLIDDPSRLGELAADIPSVGRALIDHFWPGPLTMIFKGRRDLPAGMTAPDGTVAVRLSSHPTARLLAAASGGMITGTSANLSGFPAARDAEEAACAFPEGLAMIVADAGCSGGDPSTIIAFDGGVRLVRPGAVPFQLIVDYIKG